MSDLQLFQMNRITGWNEPVILVRGKTCGQVPQNTETLFSGYYAICVAA
jgi:hypothetical protein